MFGFLSSLCIILCHAQCILPALLQCSKTVLKTAFLPLLIILSYPLLHSPLTSHHLTLSHTFLLWILTFAFLPLLIMLSYTLLHFPLCPLPSLIPCFLTSHPSPFALDDELPPPFTGGDLGFAMQEASSGKCLNSFFSCTTYRLYRALSLS